ncbi:uncharacterized protein AAES06_013674 [Glossophaga mutica]
MKKGSPCQNLGKIQRFPFKKCDHSSRVPIAKLIWGCLFGKDAVSLDHQFSSGAKGWSSYTMQPLEDKTSIMAKLYAIQNSQQVLRIQVNNTDNVLHGAFTWWECEEEMMAK